MAAQWRHYSFIYGFSQSQTDKEPLLQAVNPLFYWDGLKCDPPNL